MSVPQAKPLPAAAATTATAMVLRTSLAGGVGSQRFDFANGFLRCFHRGHGKHSFGVNGWERRLVRDARRGGSSLIVARRLWVGRATQVRSTSGVGSGSNGSSDDARPFFGTGLRCAAHSVLAPVSWGLPWWLLSRSWHVLSSLSPARIISHPVGVAVIAGAVPIGVKLKMRTRRSGMVRFCRGIARIRVARAAGREQNGRRQICDKRGRADSGPKPTSDSRPAGR